MRRLEPRNLCENENDNDSCRVTVSDKDFGIVYALVELRGDDDIGPSAVGQKSLLRIVGTVGQDVSRRRARSSSTRTITGTGPVLLRDAGERHEMRQ